MLVAAILAENMFTFSTGCHVVFPTLRAADSFAFLALIIVDLRAVFCFVALRAFAKMVHLHEAIMAKFCSTFKYAILRILVVARKVLCFLGEVLAMRFTVLAIAYEVQEKSRIEARGHEQRFVFLGLLLLCGGIRLFFLCLCLGLFLSVLVTQARFLVAVLVVFRHANTADELLAGFAFAKCTKGFAIVTLLFCDFCRGLRHLKKRGKSDLSQHTNKNAKKRNVR